MMEDDNLDGQISRLSSPQAQEFEHPDECDVKEGHGPSSTVTGQARMSQLSCSGAVDDIFGTYRSQMLDLRPP